MAISRARRRAANSGRAASAIRGSKSFRRLLKGLPGAMRTEMADVLTKSGPSASALVSKRINSTTKRRTGRLQAGVKWKVFPRTLRLQVGFLGTKAGRAKLFYARILDVGRKAQTVIVKRGSVRKPMKIRAIAAKRFVTGTEYEVQQSLGVRLRGIWNRVLHRVAAGDE